MFKFKNFIFIALIALSFSLVTVKANFGEVLRYGKAPNGEDIICVYRFGIPQNCYPKVFQPTEEYQTILKGQEVPPGLDVQLSLITGERRAKLSDAQIRAKRLAQQHPQSQKRFYQPQHDLRQFPHPRYNFSKQEELKKRQNQQQLEAQQQYLNYLHNVQLKKEKEAEEAKEQYLQYLRKQQEQKEIEEEQSQYLENLQNQKQQEAEEAQQQYLQYLQKLRLFARYHPSRQTYQQRQYQQKYLYYLKQEQLSKQNEAEEAKEQYLQYIKQLEKQRESREVQSQYLQQLQNQKQQEAEEAKQQYLHYLQQHENVKDLREQMDNQKQEKEQEKEQEREQENLNEEVKMSDKLVDGQLNTSDKSHEKDQFNEIVTVENETEDGESERKIENEMKEKNTQSQEKVDIQSNKHKSNENHEKRNEKDNKSKESNEEVPKMYYQDKVSYDEAFGSLKKAQSIEEKIEILEQIEDIVHHIEFGQLLMKNIEEYIPYLKHGDSKIRALSAICIGSSLQNNPEARKLAVQHNLYDILMERLTNEEDNNVLKRLCYAFSNLVRGDIKMIKKIHESKGLQLLYQLYVRKPSIHNRLEVFITDIFDSEKMNEGTKLEEFIDKQGAQLWCSVFQHNILSNRGYIPDSLNSLSIMLETCQSLSIKPELRYVLQDLPNKQPELFEEDHDLNNSIQKILKYQSSENTQPSQKY